MNEPAKGKIAGINNNLLKVAFKGAIRQNEVAFATSGDLRLKAEVIRINGDVAELQVFEDTTGLRVGDPVAFTGELLVIQLGPGLLGQVYDGLQNPLPRLAEECGFFLERGHYPDGIELDVKWPFTPTANVGDRLKAGMAIGTVPENIFVHKIMLPFDLDGTLKVESIVEAGEYDARTELAVVSDAKGRSTSVYLVQNWPVKVPITAYAERLRPVKPMTTQVRIIDTFFPVARGGTYCIPGPFGAGKTVLQQITSRNADVDVVIIAACGERAGEVVETLREFPELIDPRTGRGLMERTLIICNTSSMPVASREASVYTGVTIAEYYRQMGLSVLLLADSTSRWAQALREISGRLEEIPGEEAFPAYLESVIASFYERGGLVRLHDGQEGSVTIGGTVSPAGGNFEEPVTQGTLKVVGAFHGLSRERSDARRYPAINPLESWSKYATPVDPEDLKHAQFILREGNDVDQMMKVVGEEGTSMQDFITYLKSEYLDSIYLQQDAFHDVDASTSTERQTYVFSKLSMILRAKMDFSKKEDARLFFQNLNQTTIDWNRTAMDDPAFKEIESRINEQLAEVAEHVESV